MRKKNSIMNLMALVGFVSSFAAQAASQDEVQKAVNGCKGNRGSSDIGQMPYGANDEDIKSYDSNVLCVSNKGRPLGENCEKTVQELRRVATDLNRMVKKGCEEFMPLFVGNQQLQKCWAGQAACSEANNEQLAPVKAQLAEFRAKLKEFSAAMNEQQKYVAKSSDNVVQVLGENQKARRTPAYQGSGYSSSQMGVSSISESDRLNKFQDAKIAQSLVEAIKSRFENSDAKYADVSKANYSQHMRPIGQSFEELRQLKSEVLKEQLHGFLKAEELKLATKLYENQLSETERTTDQLMAANQKSMSNLGSLGAAAGSAAQAMGAKGNQASSGVGGGGTYNEGSGLSYGSGNTAATNPNNGNQLDSVKNTANSGTTSPFGEETSISNSSSASRSPASASSLKDQLRKRLASGGKSGSAGGEGASMAGGAAAGAGAEGAREGKSKAGGVPGSLGVEGEGLAVAGGGAPDPMLEGFNAETLDKGGIYIPGSGIDESVKELLGEFESAMNPSTHQLSHEIGASDSTDLFARVREFHGRCLKRGCVTGTGKGEI